MSHFSKGGEAHAHAQAAQAGRGVQLQARAVLLGHGMNDGQAQAAAMAAGAGGAVEAVEHALAVLGCDAGAAVLHHKGQPQGSFCGGGFVRPLHAQGDAAAHSVFDGIVQQDAQHFFQMALVTLDDRRNSGINGKIELQLFFKGAARHALPQQIAVRQPARDHRVVAEDRLVDDQRLHQHQLRPYFLYQQPLQFGVPYVLPCVA